MPKACRLPPQPSERSSSGLSGTMAPLLPQPHASALPSSYRPSKGAIPAPAASPELGPAGLAAASSPAPLLEHHRYHPHGIPITLPPPAPEGHGPARLRVLGDCNAVAPPRAWGASGNWLPWWWSLGGRSPRPGEGVPPAPNAPPLATLAPPSTSGKLAAVVGSLGLGPVASRPGRSPMAGLRIRLHQVKAQPEGRPPACPRCSSPVLQA